MKLKGKLATLLGASVLTTLALAYGTAWALPNIATAPGYKLSVFAKASSVQPAGEPQWKPDPIVQMGKYVYVAYQKSGDPKSCSTFTSTTPDGASCKPVTNNIVRYDLHGKALKIYNVPGHCDGILARPDLNQLWALANEDGNPELTVIDLTSGNQKTYPATVNPTAHGGGFDDMQLINGVVYMSASNPTTPGAAAPTVVTLTPNDKTNTFDVAPVLAGDATALDITPSNSTYNQPVTLALSDPDSEETTTDSSGKPVLVLDSQADGKLVFIHNPGSAQQTVSVLSLTLYDVADGPMEIVDDTRFVPADPDTFMLFCDGYGTVYRLNGHFKSGDAYSNGQDMVMKLDKTTGIETPVVAAIGVAALHDPHGMLFFNDEN